MKEQDLFDALENIDESFIAEAMPEDTSGKTEAAPPAEKHRRSIIIKSLAAAACICLVAAGALALRHNSGGIKNNADSAGRNNGLTPNESSNSAGIQSPELDGDFSRNPQDGDLSSNETAIIAPWEDRTLPGKFPEAEINGSRFSGRYAALGAWQTGKKLTSLTLTGWDEITANSHTANAEVFEIKGISPDCAAALKFDGAKEYYVYTSINYQPETLWQFIADLDLKNTLTVGKAYRDFRNKKGEYINAEYTGLSTEIVFEKLLDKTDISSVKNFDSAVQFGDTVMSLSIDIELLGYKNISLWMTEDGYLVTNILDTGKAFFIGKDKVNEFISYVESNCKKTKYEVTSPQDYSPKRDESGAGSAASSAVSSNTAE